MKLLHPRTAGAVAAALTLLFSTLGAQAQDLKIGLIDMQRCMTEFYKSKQEAKKIDELAKEKRAELDERNADYQKLNKILSEEDKKARDTALGQELRQAAMSRVQELLEERQAKLREVQEFQRKVAEQLSQAQAEMQARLYNEVKVVVEEVAAAEKLDLVQDRSFIPRGNKVLLYVSDKVPDITEGVLTKLNADAPPEEAAAGEAEGGDKAGEAKPE